MAFRGLEVTSLQIVWRVGGAQGRLPNAETTETIHHSSTGFFTVKGIIVVGTFESARKMA